MIVRKPSEELRLPTREYPAVTVLEPRQAGKTTLVRRHLPDHRFVNLELPDVRAFAREDPSAFLADNLVAGRSRRDPAGAGAPELFDLRFRDGPDPVGVEVKSAATLHATFRDALVRFDATVTPLAKRWLVHDGAARRWSDGVEAMSYRDVGERLRGSGDDAPPRSP